MWAQSLSWTEALDRMQNHNQKLKGIEKQTEAATEGKKSLSRALLATVESQCKLYAPRRPLVAKF